MVSNEASTGRLATWAFIGKTVTFVVLWIVSVALKAIIEHWVGDAWTLWFYSGIAAAVIAVALGWAIYRR